jgi:hypothetical protein
MANAESVNSSSGGSAFFFMPGGGNVDYTCYVFISLPVSAYHGWRLITLARKRDLLI